MELKNKILFSHAPGGHDAARLTLICPAWSSTVICSSLKILWNIVEKYKLKYKQDPTMT